ncbi:MAG TPA: ATP-binding cassette domain-containing protein [Cyclobacteriaceae bacterium]|nr:ATP-binding cassette domain-containing protein [Cyclobacteriaceae bacterium]
MNTDVNLVELHHITHAFGDHRVLSDVTLSFEKERITAILGKSGSGKSTLLQLINGMIRPNGGQVMLQGKPLDYRNIHTVRLQIGYVVQHVGLFPHMTVRDNIMLLGKISKMSLPAIIQRMKMLMEMVRLPLSYYDKYPYQLSGGEQQRAGLCRAMLLHPSLLLMDEPFASLDYATKQGIYQHLLEIQKTESRTVVIVTHDWEEAIKLADHFVWIADGTIKASGDKSQLITLKNTYLSEP